jgi:hypothetical protein
MQVRVRTTVFGLAIVCWTGLARAIYADPAQRLTLGGSLRTTAAVYRPHELPGAQTGGLSLTSLRLTADGKPAKWLAYELHGVQDVLTAPAAIPGIGFVEPETARYRLAPLSSTWLKSGDVTARLWCDRAWLKYRLPGFDVTLGRQPVSFGKARFWNPLDVFLPFDPRQFDREYKLGVDALRVDVPLGSVSGLSLVATPGRVDPGNVYHRSWYGSAVLGRGYTNLGGWDLTAQAGKVYGGYQVGGGFAGTLGPVELRGEAAEFQAIHDPAEPTPVGDHLLGVFGVGRLFDSSLNLQAEYLFNGAASDHLDVAVRRVAAGRALQMSRNVVAGLVAYDLMPVLNGSVATLVSLSDGSCAFLPGFRYSVSDESDLLAGALLGMGRRPRPGPPVSLRSEFGSYPDFYYLMYRVYF